MTSTRDSGLTRKQRREQARAERKAAEAAKQARETQRKRLIQLASVIGLVVAAVVVIAFATSGGSKGGIPTSTTEQNAVSKEVASLVNGIPQSGNALGSPTAPVTLAYFGDLECPFCREFTLTTLQTIVLKWVRTGKVRLEYRSMKTATREPETFSTQQVAALAAGKQNKAWQFIETFYREQGQEGSEYVNEAYLQKIANQIPGLNHSEWGRDRSDPQLASQIETDKQIASNERFAGTPSFLLGRSRGALKKFEAASVTDATPFNEAIEKLLKA